MNIDAINNVMAVQQHSSVDQIQQERFSQVIARHHAAQTSHLTVPAPASPGLNQAGTKGNLKNQARTGLTADRSGPIGASVKPQPAPCENTHRGPTQDIQQQDDASTDPPSLALSSCINPAVLTTSFEAEDLTRVLQGMTSTVLQTVWSDSHSMTQSVDEFRGRDLVMAKTALLNQAQVIDPAFIDLTASTAPAASLETIALSFGQPRAQGVGGLRALREKDRVLDPALNNVSSVNTGLDRLTPQAVLPPSPVAVAEQVKHWLVRDIQHAQLSLNGLGNEPVQVDISVQGAVAQVVFTTDNAQARHLIQTSLQELSTMLSQEGLMLSGASVGTSAQGQASASLAAKGYVTVRNALEGVVAEEISTGMSMRTSQLGGLDLYV